MKELGDAVANRNISSKESLENAAKETTVAWYPVATYVQSESQPISSFNEKNSL